MPHFDSAVIYAILTCCGLCGVLPWSAVFSAPVGSARTRTARRFMGRGRVMPRECDQDAPVCAPFDEYDAQAWQCADQPGGHELLHSRR